MNAVETRKRETYNSPMQTLRVKAGLRLADLESLTGIQRSYLSRLESGQRRFNEDTLRKVALALDCSFEDLLKRA